MVDRGQSFNVGQTVTVLAEEAVFVGEIVDCKAKFKCNCCDDNDRGKDKCDDDKHKDKKDDVECDTFLVLQLEEDVEVEGDIVFQEGQLVFINFCEITAIAPGFPPEKKNSD